jgi:hypothetical protein
MSMMRWRRSCALVRFTGVRPMLLGAVLTASCTMSIKTPSSPTLLLRRGACWGGVALLRVRREGTHITCDPATASI